MSLLVIAFDFGTTYSGYAFSLCADPQNVQTNAAWNAGSQKLISQRTPTSVLIDPDGEFKGFGFEAENKYAELADDDKHHGWRLFHRFKMILHNNMTLSRESLVEDINGETMEALPIFAMAIRYLKEHFLEAVGKQKFGIILETDVHYVITVPAIWDDGAKQFMREAVKKAGIDSTRVRLALEPEAASVWCETLTIDAGPLLTKSGIRYMVVDLGGGTADISVHERKPNGKLKEIHKASGGPWGGMFVDKQFLSFLDSIFGEGAIKTLKNKDMSDYIDLLRDFETKKRNVGTSSTDYVTFVIPLSLQDMLQETIGETLADRIASLALNDAVKLRGGNKLRVDQKVLEKMFDEPIDMLINHITALLAEKHMVEVKYLLLVGGFGESPYVQERIKSAFSDRQLIIPADAGLAVLKGAVRFGHEPEIVTSRVMKYTYGIAFHRPFDEKIHRQDKMFTNNGERRVRDLFKVFVRANEEVKIGDDITVKSLRPTSMTQTQVKIYSSLSTEPEYVTDSDCQEVGSFVISHPEGLTYSDKLADVTFIFSDTELLVKVKMQKTDKEKTYRFNSFN